MRRIHLLTTALVAAATLYGAETPIPAPPTEWVTDTANFLSPETVSALDARLAEYERRTGHQVIVYIAPTTGDAPIEDWAVRAFAKWKVGRKGLDDGLALFIFPQDRRMRIEVGYGLEPVVPDAIASRVINEVMAPRIQAGQRDEAVTAAIDSLTRRIDAQSTGLLPPPESPPEQRAPMSPLEKIFWGFIGLFILGLLVTHPRLAFLFLITIFSRGGGAYRGGGGGFGWGGGGFSGAGGRSGGGGASGSW